MRRFFSLLKGLLLGLFAIAPKPSLAGGPPRAVIVIYDGWGDPSGFSLSGRVLEDDGEKAPAAGESEARNLVRTLKALESDELKGVDVKVTIAGMGYSATTDDDGNFRVEVEGLPMGARLAPGVHEVKVAPAGKKPVRAEVAVGTVTVLDGDKPFVAVISDVDDTVVKTNVTDKKELLKTVLLKNAAQLEPVAGAAENYTRAKEKGVAAFFYLSGSPQNLYTRLRAFLERNQFPRGPLLLKNIGEDSITQQQGYKGDRLDALLARFPQMRVVLIGDSGEHDPEIYRAARERHKERVIAIVIRKAPGANNDAKRFAGFTTIDDAYASPELLASLVAAPSP